MKRSALMMAVCLFTTLCASPASSADWDSCADDLARLGRASRNAADAANDVKSKADDFESCKRNPDFYDFMRDGCRSKAYDYQSATSTLESELSTVDSRVRSVSLSCGMNLSSRRRVPSSGNQMCDLIRSYKNRLPLETLIKSCTQSMSEAECRKCLSQ